MPPQELGAMTRALPLLQGRDLAPDRPSSSTTWAAAVPAPGRLRKAVSFRQTNKLAPVLCLRTSTLGVAHKHLGR